VLWPVLFSVSGLDEETERQVKLKMKGSSEKVRVRVAVIVVVVVVVDELRRTKTKGPEPTGTLPTGIPTTIMQQCALHYAMRYALIS